MTGLSNIARIREQIEHEYQAAERIFRESAIAAQHAFIEKRQENLGRLFEELQHHMPKDEAMALFIAVTEGERHAEK